MTFSSLPPPPPASPSVVQARYARFPRARDSRSCASSPPAQSQTTRYSQSSRPLGDGYPAPRGTWSLSGRCRPARTLRGVSNNNKKVRAPLILESSAAISRSPTHSPTPSPPHGRADMRSEEWGDLQSGATATGQRMRNGQRSMEIRVPQRCHTATRLRLTVRHRVGAIAGPTQLLVRTENNVDHLVLVLAGGGTVGDA